MFRPIGADTDKEEFHTCTTAARSQSQQKERPTDPKQPKPISRSSSPSKVATNINTASNISTASTTDAAMDQRVRRNRDIPMAGHTVTTESPDAAAFQAAIVAAADSLASGEAATPAAIEVLPNGEKKFSHLVFKPAVSTEKSEKSSKSNLSDKQLEARRLEKLALEVESPVHGLD